MNILLALILMINALTGPDPATRTAYTWPLPKIQVTRRFDPPPQPWLPGHRGVDLAGYSGEQVTAAAAGTIAFAGTIAGRGVVSIVHPDGIKTTYEPVQPTVATGQKVKLGEPIGVLAAGHEGCPAAACLHWGAKQGEIYQDPIKLLHLGKIRLKAIAAAPAPTAAHPQRTHRSARTLAAGPRRRRD